MVEGKEEADIKVKQVGQDAFFFCTQMKGAPSPMQKKKGRVTKGKKKLVRVHGMIMQESKEKRFVLSFFLSACAKALNVCV